MTLFPDAAPSDVLPNSDDPFAAKRAEIDAALARFMEGVDIHEAREIDSEDLEGRANDFIAGATKLLRQAQAACKAERKPYVDTADGISYAWSPIIERLEKIIAVVKPKLKAWLDLKQEAQRKAGEEAARRRREAEAAAAKATAEAAAAETASARIEAEERAAANARIVNEARIAQARAAEPTRAQSATGLANRRGLRTVYTARIVSLPQALAHYAKRPAVADLLLQLANAELRHAPVVRGVKSIPQIPGVTFDKDQVL